jgi:hypothetical protein
MCFKCHSGLSNENINQQLKIIIKNRNYNNFNTTSIEHLFIIASGYNNEINQQLALYILNDFMLYLDTRSLHYIPCNGIEEMYSKAYINYIINSFNINSNMIKLKINYYINYLICYVKNIFNNKN